MTDDEWITSPAQVVSDNTPPRHRLKLGAAEEAMTDLTISQDAREAQAALYEQMGKPGMAEEIRAGEQDDHPGVQAFARFEAHLRTPAIDTEAMRLLREARGLFDENGALFCDGDHQLDVIARIDALAKGRG